MGWFLMKSCPFFIALNFNSFPYIVFAFFFKMFKRSSSCTWGNFFVSCSSRRLAFFPTKSTTRLRKKWINRLRIVWNLEQPFFQTRANSAKTTKPMPKENVNRNARRIAGNILNAFSGLNWEFTKVIQPQLRMIVVVCSENVPSIYFMKCIVELLVTFKKLSEVYSVLSES